MEKSTSGAMSLRREYMRNWRAKNRDKVREYNVRYWEKRLKRESTPSEQKAGDSDE